MERESRNRDERAPVPPMRRPEPNVRSLAQAVQDRLRALERYPAAYRDLMEAVETAIDD